MMRRKILVVANADSPLLRERVQMAINSGHEVVWYSESIRRPSAPCRVVHARKMTGIGVLDKLMSLPRFFHTYLVERPDLLHVHWALFTPLLLKPGWPNLLVSVMGSDVNLPGRVRLRRLSARMALRKARLITSKSESMDRAICALGDFAAKIERITWGIEEGWFALGQHKSQCRARLGIDDAAIVFFSPRALQRLYRIPEIVRAFGRLCEECGDQDLRLYVAGLNADPAVQAEVEDILDQTSLRGRVKLVGELDRDDMQTYVGASDAAVSFARSDGMPQSLYELMAAGCFPIFTDLPCYAELLEDGRNALLCDSSDPGSVYLQMKAFLSLRHAADYGRILEDNRTRVRELASGQVQQQRLESLYGRMLTDGPSA